MISRPRARASARKGQSTNLALRCFEWVIVLGWLGL